MAGNKYLTILTGIETMVSANETSSGVADANKIVALDSSGHLDLTLMPSGIGPNVKVLPTTEDIAAGKYVNVYSAAGISSVRLADNSNGRPAHGFVKEASLSGAVTTVYFPGAMNDQLSGMTPDAREYLGTAGGLTETPVSAAGYLHQYIGKAVSATELPSEIFDYVVM